MDIQTTKSVLTAAINYAQDAVLMEGVHGIGKSQIVEQFCDEDNIHLEILMLSHQEVGDLIGIPHMIEKGGETITTWSVPIWLQRMKAAAALGKRCCLFLDELNRAPIDVLQSALQLVLEGRIHEHSLPVVNGYRTGIVAAINPADQYQTNELDPALLDRFLCISVEPDLKAWLAWAKSANINVIIRDFLMEYPKRLHYTPDEGIGTSPRSWAKLSKYMDNAEHIPDYVMTHCLIGKLGTEVGSQFFTFYKDYKDVIKMEDIEAVVKKYKDKTSTMEELGSHVADLIEKTEPLQQSEMAEQLADKYMPQKDILPFLAYLYALKTETLIAFLQHYRETHEDEYTKLAEVDYELNDKKLFKKVVQASKRK